MTSTKPLLLMLLGMLLWQHAILAGETEDKATLTFANVDYVHRWSKDTQHGFTPKAQTNLETWVEMITLNYYPNAKGGEGLATTANAVLGNYQSNKAMILDTSSVPERNGKPAEHFIAALFPRPTYIEAVFLRLNIVDGVSMSACYSHREYGKKVGNQMSAWLQKHGPVIEKQLMNWKTIPSLDDSKDWKGQQSPGGYVQKAVPLP